MSSMQNVNSQLDGVAKPYCRPYALSSAALLTKQLQQLQSQFAIGLVGDNIHQWQVIIQGPPNTIYEGGIFQAILSFPEDFPMKPPHLRFISRMWHPNIAPNGDVCISILHPPEADEFGYEDASERWTPARTIESVLLSINVLLGSPNIESPANLDAAKQLREDYNAYKKVVRMTVDRSLDSC